MLTYFTRDYHADFITADVSYEIDALINISKRVDTVDNTLQLSDCIAVIGVVVVDVIVQPDQENVLYHLDVGPST